jgi:hypothetical protein
VSSAHQRDLSEVVVGLLALGFALPTLPKEFCTRCGGLPRMKAVFGTRQECLALVEGAWY